MSLIEKIRKARESVVEVGGHKFTIRRPTEAEQAEYFRAGQQNYSLNLVKKFVVDWTLKEIDLIEGGNPEPVPFEAELWAEYVSDKSDLWQPIAKAIQQSVLDQRAKVDGSVKK